MSENRGAAPPIIDIEVLGGDPRATEAAPVVAAIHDACLDTGFFVVVGHGLDEAMDAVFDAARRFFDAPQAAKERTPRLDRYGYVPMADLALDRRRGSENTEYIDMGLADEVDLPDLPGFADAVRSYQAAALEVGARLLGAMALALGADPTFFADRMADPQCRLRFLHYPEVQPGADGSLKVSTTPHTDYGALTLLATDGVAGLEVRPAGQGWTPVEAPAGALIVNLGDMLARWTNDRYRSTPHRVVGPTGSDRISIPFFVNPDPDTVVTCIPACVSADRPARYGPVTAGAFLAQRIDGSAEPYVDPGEGPVRRMASEKDEELTR